MLADKYCSHSLNLDLYRNLRIKRLFRSPHKCSIHSVVFHGGGRLIGLSTLVMRVKLILKGIPLAYIAYACSNRSVNLL